MARAKDGDEEMKSAMPADRREQQYRGQKIVMLGGAEQPRLVINGREIPVEKTPGGYVSHEFMFKEFGTLDELAEELIRQWGTAKIEPGKNHPGHSHDHGQRQDSEHREH